MQLKSWFRRVGIWVLALAALAAALVWGAAQRGDAKRERRVDVPAHDLRVTADAASIERGRYLFSILGCGHCHGPDGAGRVFVDSPDGLKVKAPHISAGAGSVTTAYTPRDWERVLRHGAKPDGRPLLIMPSEDFAKLSDADIAAIVGYTQSLPATQGSAAEFQLPLIVRAMLGFGVIPTAPEKIDHQAAHVAVAQAATAIDQGRYMAQMCVGCHGPGFSGGRIPGAPPEWPPAANLTPGEGGAMRRYGQADAFVAMLRSGKRPDGSAVSTVMPFESLKGIDEADARAIHAFLQTTPPKPAGQR